MKFLFPVIILAYLISSPAQDKLNKARTLIENDKYFEAKKILTAFTKEKKANAEGFYLLSKCLMNLGQIDDAVEACEMAVEIEDRNAEYHFMMGQLYGRQAIESNVFKKATLADNIKHHFERSVELDPAHIDGRIGLIQYYWQAPSMMGGDIEKAFRNARELVKIDEARGREMLAGLYRSEKKFSEADQEITKLLKLDELRGRAAIARNKWQEEKFSEVENEFKQIEKLIKSNKKFYYIYGWYGKLLFDQKRYNEEIEKFKTWIKVAPYNAESHFALAQAYETMNKKKEAIAACNAALKVNPEHQKSKEKLEELKNK